MLNFGAIGMILAHELIHTFDDMGRKFDKTGNYLEWWSKETITNFKNRAQCFVDHYNGLGLDGVAGHVIFCCLMYVST